MQTPPAISSSYALYKEGTNKLCRWIVTTARNCRRSFVDPNKDKLSASDLLNLAKKIAAWKPAVDIPGHVIEGLDEVISRRTSCATYYASRAGKSSPEDIASDQRHAHFISVLQEIHDVLKDAKLARKAKKKETANYTTGAPTDKSKDSNREDGINNLFELLQLEDPSEDADSHKPCKAQAGPAKPLPPPTLVTDDKEEKRFAVWCLFKDMRPILAFVKRSWEEYRAGSISFAVAGDISGRAGSTVQQACTELLKTYPDLTSYTAAVETLGLRLPSQSHSLTVSDDSERPAEDGDADMILPLSGALAVSLLEHWLPVHAHVQAGKKNHLHTTYRYDHPEEAPVEFKFHPFATQIWNSFPDLYREVRRGYNQQSMRHQGQLIKALAFMEQERLVPIVAVYLLQMNMDAHEVLQGLEVGRPDLLLDPITQNQCCEFIGEHFPEQMRQGVCETCQNNHEHDDEKEERDMHSDSLLPGERWYPDSLSSDLHIFAAEEHNLLCILTHGHGLRVTNTDKFVVTLAHFYQALKHIGLIELPWKDMDWFINNHFKDRLSVKETGPQRGLEFWIRRTAVALGIPLALMTPEISKAGFRRYCSGPGRAEIKIDSPSRFFRQCREQAERHRALGVERGAIGVTLEKMLSKQEGATAGSQQKPAQCSAMRLLQEFKKMRVVDDEYYQFDYQGFWLSCAKLLVKIRNLSGHKSQCDSWAGTANALVFMMVDAEQYETRKTLNKSKMALAARVLEKFVESEGDHFTSKAAARTKGYTGSLEDVAA